MLQMDPFERHCMSHFEEEERLLHVAMTRAREGLYLLTTRKFLGTTSNEVWPATPSFFLRDVRQNCSLRVIPKDTNNE